MWKKNLNCSSKERMYREDFAEVRASKKEVCIRKEGWVQGIAERTSEHGREASQNRAQGWLARDQQTGGERSGVRVE